MSDDLGAIRGDEVMPMIRGLRQRIVDLERETCKWESRYNVEVGFWRGHAEGKDTACNEMRRQRDRALAAARELRADIGNAGTMVAKLYEKATASPTHSITLAAELLFVLLKDLHGVLARTAWLDAPEEPLARTRTE